MTMSDLPASPPPRRSPIGIRAWPLRAALALAVLVVIGFFLYRTTQPTPDERDRLTHSDGYSMIGPHGWLAKASGDRILFQPDVNQWKGLAPSIWARRLPSEPVGKDADGYVAGQFQSQPARVRDRQLKRTTVRTVLVERNGELFEIGVELPGLEAAKMNGWWRFAETFRTARTPPATMSAT